MSHVSQHNPSLSAPHGTDVGTPHGAPHGPSHGPMHGPAVGPSLGPPPGVPLGLLHGGMHGPPVGTVHGMPHGMSPHGLQTAQSPMAMGGEVDGDVAYQGPPPPPPPTPGTPRGGHPATSAYGTPGAGNSYRAYDPNQVWCERRMEAIRNTIYRGTNDVPELKQVRQQSPHASTDRSRRRRPELC